MPKPIDDREYMMFMAVPTLKQPAEVVDVACYLLELVTGYMTGVDAIAAGDEKGTEVLAQTYNASKDTVLALCGLMLGNTQVRPHAFDPTPYSEGDCCVAMVMRDGGGDQCGLPRGHFLHEVSDG